MPKEKTGLPPGLAMMDELPPGLAMQVEKNGVLPPGLAKRVDGRVDTDVFVVNGGFSDPNQVLINQGGDQGGIAGDFDLGIDPEGGIFSNAVALGDVDGDGDLDAFEANGFRNLVLINQGGDQEGIGGDFDQGILPEGGATLTQAVALGDLDGDGDLDAFIVDTFTPNRVLINQGGDQGGIAGDFDLGIEPEQRPQSMYGPAAERNRDLR
jgi:hypothetical protein